MTVDSFTNLRVSWEKRLDKQSFVCPDGSGNLPLEDRLLALFSKGPSTTVGDEDIPTRDTRHINTMADTTYHRL